MVLTLHEEAILEADAVARHRPAHEAVRCPEDDVERAVAQLHEVALLRRWIVNDAFQVGDTAGWPQANERESLSILLVPSAARRPKSPRGTSSKLILSGVMPGVRALVERKKKPSERPAAELTLENCM